MTTRRTVRIAAVSDIHFGRTPPPGLQPLLTGLVDQADVLVICGDLTDTGLPDEARQLARELSALKLPTVAVLGNHDFEHGQPAEIARVLCDGGIQVLDGDTFEFHNVGFAGVKGFAGGFGRRALGPWGEPVIKAFVQEALSEALKLETSLAKLRTERKIAVLHYSPIQGTVEGEPPEIYPYLGSSRLEEPLSRYPVDAVLHGHAHHGTPEGRTLSGIPVYNVSYSLLQRIYPDRPPFRLLEFEVDGPPTPTDQRTEGPPLSG